MRHRDANADSDSNDDHSGNASDDEPLLLAAAAARPRFLGPKGTGTFLGVHIVVGIGVLLGGDWSVRICVGSEGIGAGDETFG